MADTNSITPEVIRIRCAGGEIAIVDANTPLEILQFNWYIRRMKRGGSYVAASKGPFLHRLLMNAPTGVTVDHKNGDCLDNRLANLRLVTSRQNTANRLPFKGDFTGIFQAKNGRWRAMISDAGKRLYLGTFDHSEDAAEAYKKAHLKIHGEFSYYARRT